jgi:hypothetical protein
VPSGQSLPATVMAFVDVGYLTAGAQVADLRLPTKPRIDGNMLRLWASRAETGWRNDQLLRVYVYDAQYPRDANQYPDQRAYFDVLGAQPGIRLRLGHLSRRAPGSSR